MVERLWLIEFSHPKEEQNISAFLYTLVGLVVKKTNTNTLTSPWCVGIKSNTVTLTRLPVSRMGWGRRR